MNSDSDQIMDKPILMDEKILQNAVDKQFSQDKAKGIHKMEGIHFSEVLTLHLEYKNILRIDHLLEFTSLTRLDLNNNLIGKIEGLDPLINLTWLNLSFNRIKKIEGLESLRKLEVLNLSKNNISVIENMDALENLSHFFIKNNLLDQLDNVLYLRKFRKLFAISLCGNPVSEEDDCKYFIAAYFPNLRLLDHRFLDEETKNEASRKYHYVLEKKKHEELQKQQADEVEQSQEAELKLHKDAFVEFLNGSCLFKSMFEDDPDAETLRCVPAVASLLETFERQMVELCMQLFETGLAGHEQRKTEMDSFFSGQYESEYECRQKASQMLAKFDEQHTERIGELQQLTDPDIRKVKIDLCNEELKQLCKSLMTLELQLVSQLEDDIRKFDISISDSVNNFRETAQGIFIQCRDLEDEYYRKVQEVAVATEKKVAKDTLEEFVPDDVITLFRDKGAVMDALAAGHENHLRRIKDRETELVTRVSAWKVTLFEEIQDKGVKQNHMNISDIRKYVDLWRDQLEELQ